MEFVLSLASDAQRRLHSRVEELCIGSLGALDRGAGETDSVDLRIVAALAEAGLLDWGVPGEYGTARSDLPAPAAMGSLDCFRTTVGACAVGFAQRALDEALCYARKRQAFGKSIAEFQMIQSKLAAMSTELEAARLLVYRAAMTRDSGRKPRVTLESSQAKLFATEAAQRIIDQAVPIHGGAGVMKGNEVKRLYREIRALRIYEGTSEIQHLVIASQLLKDA